MTNTKTPIASRFRGYLPVVVDVETAGLNPETDALLEIAAIILTMNHEGLLMPDQTLHAHVMPFPNANLDAEALAINKIDPHHPFRAALDEQEALDIILKPIRKSLKDTGCNRATLVGHNPFFDCVLYSCILK